MLYDEATVVPVPAFALYTTRVAPQQRNSGFRTTVKTGKVWHPRPGLLDGALFVYTLYTCQSPHIKHINVTEGTLANLEVASVSSIWPPRIFELPRIALLISVVENHGMPLRIASYSWLDVPTVDSVSVLSAPCEEILELLLLNLCCYEPASYSTAIVGCFLGPVCIDGFVLQTILVASILENLLCVLRVPPKAVYELSG